MGVFLHFLWTQIQEHLHRSNTIQNNSPAVKAIFVKLIIFSFSFTLYQVDVALTEICFTSVLFKVPQTPLLYVKIILIIIIAKSTFVFF